MAGVDISWPEAKAYIADSVSMYESDDADFKMVSSLRQLRTDIATLINSREADAKKIIAELQGRITTAEGEASSILPSIDSIREQLMAIEERKSKILADIGRMKAAKDTSAASLHALTQQIAAIKHAQQTLLADHTSAVPRVKHSLSLYTNISSIRWDYDSELVTGYIAPPDGAPVRPFSFDPRLLDDKTIADRLWDVIGEAHGVASTLPAHLQHRR